MRLHLALALAAAGLASTASAQSVLGLEPGAQLRLQNELRRQEGQIRALEAQADAFRTEQTIRGLQAGRAPDPTVARRLAEQDAAEAEALGRAAQAASTARAARLRAASPAYDQRLRDLGYASSLPLAPR